MEACEWWCTWWALCLPGTHSDGRRAFFSLLTHSSEVGRLLFETLSSFVYCGIERSNIPSLIFVSNLRKAGVLAAYKYTINTYCFSSIFTVYNGSYLWSHWSAK